MHLIPSSDLVVPSKWVNFVSTFGCKQKHSCIKHATVYTCTPHLSVDTCRCLVFDTFEPIIPAVPNCVIKSFKSSMSEAIRDRLIHFTDTKTIRNVENTYNFM